MVGALAVLVVVVVTTHTVLVLVVVTGVTGYFSNIQRLVVLAPTEGLGLRLTLRCQNGATGTSRSKGGDGGNHGLRVLGVMTAATVWVLVLYLCSSVGVMAIVVVVRMRVRVRGTDGRTARDSGRHNQSGGIRSGDRGVSDLSRTTRRSWGGSDGSDGSEGSDDGESSLGMHDDDIN